MFLNNYLSMAEFEFVIFSRVEVSISDTVYQKVNESFEFLRDFSSEKIIYGVNTGFGPMAQYKIEKEQQTQLQYNLIRSHASGTGQPLSEKQVKAAILARMNSL